MVTAMLSEYLSYITEYEAYFSEWDAIYRQWYLNFIKQKIIPIASLLLLS
ncbi:hypothetical protein FACS189473_4590 [Spirochaetia bacterium]|nr:hypothetical protein FACS189473_4590 [Spirochaetia bacterium]